MQNKNLLYALQGNFILTGDFGRPYEILQSVKTYIIEHLIRAMEVFTCFLFNQDVVGFEVLTPLAKQAWGHLRRAGQHFLRPVITGQELPNPLLSEAQVRDIHADRVKQLVEQAARGRAELQKLACLMQKVRTAQGALWSHFCVFYDPPPPPPLATRSI